MSRYWQVSLAAAVLAGMCTGCAGEDVDRMSRVWEKVAGRLDALTKGTRDKLSAGWQSVQEDALAPASLQAKVTWRLRTDKALAGSRIEVRVNGAEVELQGEVEDSERQRRAVELAETTEGVERVIDGLTVNE